LATETTPWQRRILVIDDEVAIQRDFRHILVPDLELDDELRDLEAVFLSDRPETHKEPPFEVDAAANGREGLERVATALAKGRPYALAFIDLRLSSDWDGLETMRELWVKDPDLQVVVCTGFVDESLDRAHETLGSTDQFLILKKPFDPLEVRQLARSLTMKWHLARQSKLAQRILELTVHELQESNSELERFSYVASHHLQEPLRTIATQCEMLRRRYANRIDEEADGYIERAVRGAARAQQLILDLLAYSQIQEPKSPFATVDLNELLAEIVSTLASPADTIVQVDVDPLPSVVGDRDQLALVFENLLENAVKYRSGDSVSIRLDAQQCGDRWRIRVADDGIGISDEYHESVFELFERLHSADRYPGTGVGLSICKKIIDRHGGKISVETLPGAGSAFVVSLPVKGASSASEKSKNQSA